MPEKEVWFVAISSTSQSVLVSPGVGGGEATLTPSAENKARSEGVQESHQLAWRQLGPEFSFLKTSEFLTTQQGYLWLPEGRPTQWLCLGS